MSDVFVPGVRSRFNTDKLIEDLMQLERLPKERAEKNIDSLEVRKTWWNDLGTCISSMRESARFLFSFQNPFNDRTALSSNEDVITANVTREAAEQEFRFTVKQLAQADRFLSPPLDEKTRIEAGTYTYNVGSDEVTLNFRGGTLREFADALNRRGRDKIGASILTVQPGTRSLLLESKITGSENRLGFSGDAATMAITLGMIEEANDSRREIIIAEGTVKETHLPGGIPASGPIAIEDGALELPSMASASIPISLPIAQNSPLVLRIETRTSIKPDAPLSIPQPPPGPDISSSGSVSYGGITVENNPSSVPLPEWTPPPPPQRLDNLAVFSLSFTDGSKIALPAINDTGSFIAREYNLSEYAGGRTIASLNIENSNTHREIAVRKALIFDPGAAGGGYKPLNPVSIAQDSIVSMEGIEMIRPSNTITDIIPGVTVTARSVSERPVRLNITTDRENIKNGIISLIGNYNRLMAELNILTRTDPAIIDEITYFEKEEAAEMRLRLGAFSGDTTLNQFRTSLQRVVSSPYPTDAERELAMLAQIGISTNAGRAVGSGYNRSQMRGYLEIDPKALDAAIEQYLPAIKQLFGSDTTGDLLVDTGIAFNLDALARPYTDTGGIIALKIGTIDSSITQDKRRIETMERQIAAKEADLKAQFGRMESAFSRMEQMQSSFDNFNQQNNR